MRKAEIARRLQIGRTSEAIGDCHYWVSRGLSFLRSPAAQRRYQLCQKDTVHFSRPGAHVRVAATGLLERRSITLFRRIRKLIFNDYGHDRLNGNQGNQRACALS
jgi:hypothetical protein